MVNLLKKIGIVLIVVISIFVILSNFIDETRDSKIRERYNILKFVVDTKVSLGIDKERICVFFEHLDSIEHVFAAVYDEELNCLTNRHPDVYPDKIIKFDPLEHDDIVKHMKEYNSGEFECDFKVISDKNKNQVLFTLVYFTKVHLEDSHILCVISTPYVNEKVKFEKEYLQIILISFILIITIIGVILTVSLVKQ